MAYLALLYIVGVFSLCQAVLCLQDFSPALGAVGFMYDTTDRVSGCMPNLFCTKDSSVATSKLSL